MAHIHLDKLSLSYPAYGTKARSLKLSLMQVATGGKLLRSAKQATVLALQDISFELRPGDRLGLVGHNGSGKTSLLKVLAGIYPPSSGTLSVSGRINSLFNVMVGMDHGLTGYENIFLRGLLLGLSKSEIQKKIPEIAAFAELGDFLQMPLNSYSTGMLVRLGFSIMTCVRSDILLIDEIFGTGDAPFICKAKAKIEELAHPSNILVLSTHDEEMIHAFCNKILWLEHGTVKYFGDPITR